VCSSSLGYSHPDDGFSFFAGLYSGTRWSSASLEGRCALHLNWPSERIFRIVLALLKTFQTMIAERSIRRRDGLQTKDEGGIRADGRGRDPGQAIVAGVASQPELCPFGGSSRQSNKAKAGKI
jgi:hypothetical protein